MKYARGWWGSFVHRRWQAVVQRATDRHEKRRAEEMKWRLSYEPGRKQGGRLGEAAPPAPRCRQIQVQRHASAGLNERQDRGRQLRWEASGGARAEKGVKRNERRSAAQRGAGANRGVGEASRQRGYRADRGCCGGLRGDR